MNIKQPDTLFQTMEKWLIAYQAKHNCTEDTALDKFDELSDTIRASGKGSTASAFHNEVKASLEELTAKKSVTCQVIPDDHVFDDDGSNNAEIIITGRRACDTEQSRNLPHHVGGPLLETGIDPLSFKGDYSRSVPTLPGGVSVPPSAKLFTRTPIETSREVFNAAVTRLEIEEQLELFKGIRSRTTDSNNKLEEQIDMLESRLEMIKGVQEREKQRTGRTLTLKRPSL